MKKYSHSKGTKTSDFLARSIVQDIKQQNLKAGDKLPGEALMLKQYQVSRSSLREALRMLESNGILRIKPGANGGPIVGAADPAYLGNNLALFLNMADAKYSDLSEFLLIIYALVARLAAERATPEQAVALQRQAADHVALPMPQDTESKQPSREPLGVSEFHIVLQYAAGNLMLELLLDSVRTIFVEHILASTNVRIFACDPAEHQAIADRIAAGDGDGASSLMHQHISRVVDSHRVQIPGLYDAPIRW